MESQSTVARSAAPRKRVRIPDPDPSPQTAEGPAPAVQAATLHELTQRVTALEERRRQDAVWWTECGRLMNKHADELEELQEESVNNDNN